MKRGTPEHPKMGELARSLKVARCTAVGIMECLWHFAAKYARDGDLTRFTPLQIAEAVHWPTKRADRLWSSLFQSRWVDRVPSAAGERVLVHDWAENCEDSVHKYLAEHRLWFADGTVPKLRLLPREEKEAATVWYKTNQYATGSILVQPAVALPLPCRCLALPKQQNSSDLGSKSKPNAVKIAWTPEDHWQNITAQHREQWSKAYPAVNIERQLEAMTAWGHANPKKAHKSNWQKFVTNWLSRSQDRGGDGGNGKTAPPVAASPPPAKPEMTSVKI